MSRKDAPVFSEFWQDLVRRAPSEVRDSPATMLALSSFLEGKGAQAWTALDQLSESDPLADLVAAALDQAVDPREWDRAVPAAAGALMQQAALSDTFAQERRAHDRDARNAPPASTVPARSRRPRPLRWTEADPCRTLARDWRSASRSSSPPLSRSLLGTRRDAPRSTWSTSPRRPRPLEQRPV